MGQVIVILGGVRSGKSSFAQALAEGLGDEDVVYLATAEAGDAEMTNRIASHQSQRPSSWQTIESRRTPGKVLAGFDPEPEVVLLDCLTMWISNILLDAGDAMSLSDIEWQMLDEIESLLTDIGHSGMTLIVVSGEVGMGVVPDTLLGRQFRDLHGWANQRLVDSADQTYFMVAGRPVNLDSIAMSVEECVKECRQ
jgi:adenosylcobinamide kinase/adenosylcobinamide-phosphate guanylyltransferase